MTALRLLVVAACVAALASGCGGSSTADSTGDTTRVAAAAATNASTVASAQASSERNDAAKSGVRPLARRIRVGLVTDAGGLDDRSFNHLAYQGLLRAERQLGVQGRVLTSKAARDYAPNLARLAKERYDLVIAVGFPMAHALDTVAVRFPRTSFAIVDYSQSDLEHHPPNAEGLIFKEQEAGYLAGYLAGLVEQQDADAKKISSVGGLKIPPVDRYIAGFRAGARAADPQLKALNGYSHDFVDQAKCKEVALDQISRGSGVVFEVAGRCGLGALDAARDRNVWGIGVDADQSYLGPNILTSAVKRVDVAVFRTIEQIKDGGFAGGEDTVYDAASGGVGIGPISPRVPPAIVDRVRQREQDLVAGRIGPIASTVR